MHLWDDFTRLFLKIENINEENDCRFVRSDLRMFQGKKQFECLYGGGDSSVRIVKSIIPAGIEEDGVLHFEPLGDSQDPVRFHLRLFVSGIGDCTFDFAGIKIS